MGVVSRSKKGSWVSIKHNVPWAVAYLCTKWHLDPSSRLATIRGPKSGGASFFFGGGWSCVPI